MNYVYAALLLHSAGKKIDESSLKKVVKATGEKPEKTQLKALTAALEGVDIEEAIKAQPVAAAKEPEKEKGKEDEKKKEEEKEEKKEEAAEGLGTLFG